MSSTDRVTRRPNGKPGWPFIVLAGIDHSGKSYSAAELTGSPLIGRSFWIEYGETTADEYGSVPGADYEIVPTDGSVADLTAAVRWAVDQPRVSPDLPNLVVLDSATPLWETIVDEQQRIADRRRGKKEGEATITSDQWNAGKGRWNRIIMALKKFDGVAVVTSRLAEVTVIRNGQPTTEKQWKVQAEKNLPFLADVLVEYRERQRATLVGSRSLSLPMPDGENERPLPGFTLHNLLVALGLDRPESIAAKRVVEPNADAILTENGGSAALTDERFAELLAAARRDGVDAVKALGNGIGVPTLATIGWSSPNGMIDGVRAIQGTVHELLHAQEAPVHAPVARDDVQPPVQAHAAPVQQPVQQQAPAVRSDDDERTRNLLLDELAGQAGVLRESRGQIADRFFATLGVTIQAAEVADLRGFVFTARGQVIDIMRKEGQASAADAYERATAANAVASWAQLTTPVPAEAAPARAMSWGDGPLVEQ